MNVHESVVIRGAIALLESRGNDLSDDEAHELIELLEEFHEPGYVDAIELAIGYLRPGPEQSVDDVAEHLFEHLYREDRDLVSLAERFAAEHEMRERLNEFSRGLGEDVDPDAPLEFPEPL